MKILNESEFLEKYSEWYGQKFVLNALNQKMCFSFNEEEMKEVIKDNKAGKLDYLLCELENCFITKNIFNIDSELLIVLEKEENLYYILALKEREEKGEYFFKKFFELNDVEDIFNKKTN